MQTESTERSETLKRVFIFFLPIEILLLVLTTAYFVLDPFKVVYTYDPYTSFGLDMNRDYVSTEMFLKYNDDQHYDSFIFGSSRAIGYSPKNWIDYIGNDKHPFSFDASSENIYGIYYKMKFLDSQGSSLSDVLILVDTNENFFSEKKDGDNYLKKNHPKTLGNTLVDRLRFQYAHIKGYFNLRFLISYYGYEFFGVDNKFTNLHRLRSQMLIEYPTNKMIASGFEEFLDKNPSYYNNKEVFYPRPDEEYIYEPQITTETESVLLEMKELLDKHNTNFKIIINPMYDQRKYNSQDLQRLNYIFGESNVFDFSGKNSFTDSKYNYYENFHFRPFVGDSIMNIIY